MSHISYVLLRCATAGLQCVCAMLCIHSLQALWACHQLFSLICSQLLFENQRHFLYKLMAHRL